MSHGASLLVRAFCLHGAPRRWTDFEAPESAFDFLRSADQYWADGFVDEFWADLTYGVATRLRERLVWRLVPAKLALRGGLHRLGVAACREILRGRS